ncbi:MAG: phosphatase PAP2 family protein [Candidatus Latescibacterota bacterium]|nr:MAG: phosphatase PAP2 family protein [Candidatus Latescibacterota bacterium]
MGEALAALDTSLFRWINGHPNAVFDSLMPFVTGAGNWHLVILVTWTALLLFGGGRGRVAALLVIPLLILSDQTSSNLLKNIFERLRPCNALPDVRLLAGCSSSFSMPSSHAANFGAAALHLSIHYPRMAPILAGMALLVAYSRVYVGVHYPFDVVVGLGVGLLCALLIRGLERLGRRALRARGGGSPATSSAQRG